MSLVYEVAIAITEQRVQGRFGFNDTGREKTEAGMRCEREEPEKCWDF